MAPLPDNTNTPAFDSYWRLGEYTDVDRRLLRSRIISAGYKDVSGNMLKAHLVVKAQRLDRGWIIYQNCTDQELATFLRERRLERPGTEDSSSVVEWRNSKIRLLCRADAELEFNRFLDLPAELRKRVYELYVEAFPKVLQTPIQPPLACVSRLLRQEVLPVFYNLRTFTITLVHHNRHVRLGWRMDADTLSFLHNLANGQVSNIRSFQLNMIRRCGPNRSDITIICKFDLGIEKAECRYRNKGVAVYQDGRFLPVTQQLVGAIGLELNRVIEDITQRGGEKRFRMEDIYALRRAVESGLQ
ncbi:hypothetical protein LTR37_002295 [Vermiconidia calcicola]|uniref:Uncharacterized protein n=1 Tax=Vermiconidia calcicola TaxID=1690605 RepID=A0ACC3NT90_9PEZI|nr:hypothetical protein LTR37_002295 [Vermiconidia calcicola]